MAILFSVLIIGHFLLLADGSPKRYERFVLDNPADMSSYLGYKDHKIHDMTSLVDEAKAHAHGQSSAGSSSGSGSGASYNVPNFPGQSGSSRAGINPGTGLSFAGTNLWRCDAHIVEVCDLNCLDVDPKDGCPFCIQSCQQTLHGTTGQGTSSATGSQSGSSSQQQSGSNSGSSQSGSGAQSSSGLTGTGTQAGNSQSGSSGAGSQTGTGQPGSVSQQVSGLTGTGTQTGHGQTGSGSQQPSGLTGTGTQNVGSQSGALSQQASGLTGTGTGNSQSSSGQQPSNLAGTGTQTGTGGGQLQSGLTGTGSASGGAGAQTTVKPACPHYPPNCPAIYTKLVNGCLVCTILQQAGITAPPTTSQGPTCPPKRCVAPCNVGIVTGADGCPKCKCPDHV